MITNYFVSYRLSTITSVILKNIGALTTDDVLLINNILFCYFFKLHLFLDIKILERIREYFEFLTLLLFYTIDIMILKKIIEL